MTLLYLTYFLRLEPDGSLWIPSISFTPRVCPRHFPPEAIVTNTTKLHKKIRKTLVTGTLPTLDLKLLKKVKTLQKVKNKEEKDPLEITREDALRFYCKDTLERLKIPLETQSEDPLKIEVEDPLEIELTDPLDIKVESPFTNSLDIKLEPSNQKSEFPTEVELKDVVDIKVEDSSD